MSDRLAEIKERAKHWPRLTQPECEWLIAEVQRLRDELDNQVDEEKNTEASA